MEKEIWKDIPGYEGLYQASTIGRIRSVDRYITYKNGKEVFTQGKILKICLNTKDRQTVTMSKNGKVKSYEIQRIMGLTFLGYRPNGYHVCHVDGDKNNNNIKNLRYDSPKENCLDQYRVGKKNPNGVLEIEDVIKIKKLYSTKKYFQKDLAKMFNVSQTQISKIILGQSYSYINDDGTIDESKTQIK